MAETDFFAPRQGGYRGSRAPGFTSGPMSQSTGTLLSTIGTDTVADQEAVSQLYDTPRAGAQEPPDYLGAVGGEAAMAGGQYALSSIGASAGEAIIDQGASIGEGLSKGVSDFGTKVSGWFGGATPVNEAAIPPSSWATDAGGNIIGDAPGVGEGFGTDFAGSTASEVTGSSGFTDSVGTELTSGSNIGAGVGAGVFRTAVGLAMGEKPAQALKSGAITGVGTYVGAAIGNAILPGAGGIVGGFLGSTIGGLFGGRVICTELRAQRKMPVMLLVADLEYSRLNISPITLRGYHAWAVPFVRLMRKSKVATAVVAPFAIWRAEELAYQMGLRKKACWKGKLVRWIGEPICFAIGLFVGETKWHTLYQAAK